MTTWRETIAERLGSPVREAEPLSGGCVGEVYRARLGNGVVVVAKVDESTEPRLDIEGRMLQALRATGAIPVPAVLHSEPRLLVMDYVEAGDAVTPAAEEHAADLLATLHGLSAPRFGFDEDTLVGGLHQPNGWTASWPEFFARHRLEAMADQAVLAGSLPAALRRRIGELSGKIEQLLPSPHQPGLIHGDVWSGNVLVRHGRIAAFIDPAISFSDPEIELAVITLFGTFGERFFDRYREHRKISPDFFERRRHVYNLYPLLVHVRLFGGGYVAQVDQVLRRLGA